MEKLVLGIEIGGTKLQFAVADGHTPQPLAFERYHVDRTKGAAGILATIEEVGRRLIAQHHVHKVGFGFGGPVYRGIVVRSHQVEGWENWPLAQWCQDRLGRPAVVGNDCDVAALAEARWGAGQGKSLVFYVTVGTGVGGGLITGGRLYGTGRPAVAEIGHLRPLEPSPYADDALLRTTVESRASGLGIVETLLQLTRDDRHPLCVTAREKFGTLRWQESIQQLRQTIDSASDPYTRITAKDVAQWADAGNVVARAAFDLAIDTLGWAIAQTVTLLAPEVVVVGGGVSLCGEEMFFQPLREAVQRYVFPPLKDHYAVLPAQLGERVVALGAALLAAQEDSST